MGIKILKMCAFISAYKFLEWEKLIRYAKEAK